MPEEVGFFGRTSLYGLVLAIVYWFVSYDVAGAGLLAGFGLATGAGFVLLLRRHHGARRAAAASAEAGGEPLDPDRPFTDESGPVPLGSFAPLEVGAGVAVLGLGLVFGVWFALIATIPIAAGALAWVREARHEHDLIVGRDARTQPAGPATPGPSGAGTLPQARAERPSGDLTAR